MEKEFALYPEALELKEIGFDEPCFGYYDLDGLQISRHHWYPENKNSSFPLPDTTNNPKISAPTFAQAFRWFREKHELVHHINRDGGWWLCSILDLYDEKEQGAIETHIDNCYPDTYEEAELACLRKLIEIVKNK